MQAMAGRGSENKVPFIAAVSLTQDNRPLRVRLTALPSFTLQLIGTWAHENLAPAKHRVLRRPGLLWRRHHGRL